MHGDDSICIYTTQRPIVVGRETRTYSEENSHPDLTTSPRVKVHCLLVSLLQTAGAHTILIWRSISTPRTILLADLRNVPHRKLFPAPMNAPSSEGHSLSWTLAWYANFLTGGAARSPWFNQGVFVFEGLCRSVRSCSYADPSSMTAPHRPSTA